MKSIGRLKGYRPLCFAEDKVLLSRKNSLFLADCEGRRIQKVCRLKTPLKQRLLLESRLLTRILRYGFHYAVPVDGHCVLCVYGRKFFLLDLRTGELTLDHRLRKGSRPLMVSVVKDIDGFDDTACYGEYWGNSAKEPVNIWRRVKAGTWEVAYTFPAGTIEHIHALIPDPFNGTVWILTGDFGKSPGFWAAADNFKKVEPIAVGLQKFRAATAFPTPEGVVYGTDSPFEANAIRLLKKKGAGWDSEHLHPLAGPCIYACQVADKFIFSTSVEPGELSGNLVRDFLDRKPGGGIKGCCSEIVCGNRDTGFETITSWRKDIWPPRLCQFGTVTFPAGRNPAKSLFAYGVALSGHDDVTEVFNIA